jgi:hypothetical protein
LKRNSAATGSSGSPSGGRGGNWPFALAQNTISITIDANDFLFILDNPRKIE